MTRPLPADAPIDEGDRETLNAAYAVLCRLAEADTHPARPILRMQVNREASDAKRALIRVADTIARGTA